MKLSRPILGPVAPGAVRAKPWHRVYIARRERDGAIKIGVTGKIEWRVKELATIHGSPMTLLVDVCGGRPYERELLWRFRAYSMPNENEWFFPCQELLDFIDSLVSSCRLDSTCTTWVDDGTIQSPGCMGASEECF